MLIGENGGADSMLIDVTIAHTNITDEKNLGELILVTITA